LVMCVPSLVKLPNLPSNYIASYLSLSVTLFGYGPSLPELAFDYWAEDVVSEAKRSIIDITSMLFPLAGSSYHLGGSLEGLIKVQRALTGVGSWELEGGNDLSSMVSNNFSSTHSPGSGGVNAYSDGIWGGANYNNGGIAALEQIRDESRKSNSRHVFHYLDQMDTYAMVLQQSGPMGFRHMWETVTEHASGSANGFAMGGESRMLYTNLHPFLLPGGSVLPAKSRGVLVSGGSGKPLIVNWAHRHSGWSLLLEVLDECANRINNPSSSSPNLPTHPPMITQGNLQGTPHPNLHLKRGNIRPIPFTLMAIGVDFSSIDIQNLIIELLDLFRSVVMHKDDASHVALFESMEQSSDSTSLVEPFEDDRPLDTSGIRKFDVAQIVVRILSDALARAGSKSSYSSKSADTISKNHQLITRLLGLATDGFGFGTSPHVSTSQEYLQSSIPQPGIMVQSTTAVVLAAERATGSYSITLSIISLTRSLLDNAIESDLGTDVEAELRGQVLLNAIRFVHTNIWCEYSGWKYKRLGDRFEIGRRVAEIYYDILKNWTAGSDEAANSTNGAVFRSIATYLLEVFLLNATNATLAPLVHALTVGQDMSRALKSAKRDSEDAELVWLLQTFLLLSRILLAYKQSSPLHRRQSLLEHRLCAGTSLNFSVSSRQAKSIPIDALVNFVTTNDMGPHIPVYATDLLSSLALAFSEIEPSPPSLVTYMTDAEDATRALVNIVQNVYENPRLRRSIWNFMATTVEHQPALATSFVTGSFYTREMSTDIPSTEGPAVKDNSSSTNRSNATRSALNIATQTAPTWEGLWEKDSAILCAIMRFINAAWREKLKHSAALEAVRKDTAFWTRMVWVLRQVLSPKRVDMDGDRMDVDRPDKIQHVRITTSAYHTLIQAYVIEIFAIEIRSQLLPKRPSNTTAISLMALKNFLQVGNSLSQHLQEAIDSSFDIELHTRVHQYFHDAFPRFALEAIQSPFPITQRIFGAEYLYQVHLLEPRLLPQFKDRETATRLRLFVSELQSVNCNWSLVDSQIELTRAWKRFLQAGGATLHGDDKLRHELLRLSVLVSQKIAQEERGGSTMITVHTERLGVLLALLESTWPLSLTASKEAVEVFTKLLQNVHAIIMSDTFSPLRSLQEAYSNDNSGFHRTILQIAYFCTRKARTLFMKREMLTAEQTAVIASAMLAIVGFVSVGLSNTIDMAKIQQSVELDRDMELLVAVFEQSTRPELHTSPQLWLERVQELNLARSSLELLTKCDIGGNLMNGDDLRNQRFPLYARHMLGIQLCLSSMDSSAETLALSAAMPAYCNISIANDLTVGTLNVFHPELPGDRNPGHQAWCTILSIVTGLVDVIGPSSGYFIETEVASFIQFYGAQISRALEWNVGVPLNSGTIEELEGVTGLFHAVSVGVNPHSAADAQANSMLQIFAEKALILLQHLNYALSHPNHLTSLFEATRSDERRALETEIGQGVNMASALELLDVSKRPFSASLTQRLHSIVRNIVSTLVILTRGDEVITNEPEDWPTSLQIAPTTKVSIGEGTTMGTFLELGNGIVDLLQHFKSTGIAKLATSITIPAFDSESDTQILRQSLEAVLIFGVTQLAIWHNQAMVSDTGADEEPGTEWDDVGFGKELFTGMIGGKRVSMLPGLGGDVLNELMALLTKAKKVLSKGSNATDHSSAIIGILEGFLGLRVIG
ncbi:16260_t:CDS:2, partial [Acaulospora colombiana]